MTMAVGRTRKAAYEWAKATINSTLTRKKFPGLSQVSHSRNLKVSGNKYPVLTMLTKDCFSILKSQIKIFEFSCRAPFEWRHQPGCCTIAYASDKCSISWYLTHLILWTYSIYILGRLSFIILSNQLLEPVMLLQFSLWLYMYLALSVISLSLLYKKDEICLLMNWTIAMWTRSFLSQRNYGTYYYQFIFLHIII